MREEITLEVEGSLNVIESARRVMYKFYDGDTSLVLSTNADGSQDVPTAAKYQNAIVRVTIEIDHSEAEYDGIKP